MTDEERQDEPRPLSERLEENRRTFQPGLWLRLFVLGVAAVYLVLFIVLNTRTVKISFVFASTRVSIVIAILLSLAIGVVLGVLLSQLRRYRMRRR